MKRTLFIKIGNRHIFCLSVVVLFVMMLTLNVSAADKPKATEISFARHFAEDYLSERGAESYRLNLLLEEYTDRLFFFNDMRNHVFLLMARDEYAEMLNDQVLAFSIGVPHSKARETETFMHLYNYYDNLIKDMAEGRVPKEQKQDKVRLRIQPMLYKIRWRQFLMNDVFEGQTEPVLSGCGAVAVAQLMKYYEWPKVVSGDFTYKDTKNNLRTIKMDGTKIDWNATKGVYLYNDPQAKTLDPLMKRVAMALKVDFGNKNTTNWSKYIKRAMTMNFGYSPGMFLVSRDDVDEATMIHLIREELKAEGPSILSGGHHQFVCDGAYDDFLHLNMGWSGSYDGWYRFPVVRKEINKNSFIDTALLNIIPEETPGISKSITVETPGTLSDVLKEEECCRISSLKVSGKLNGADIRLIRRMAGALEVKDYSGWKGILKTLDLGDASIVSDTVPYFIIDAKRIHYTQVVNGTTYRFDRITDEEWATFCKSGRNNTSAYTIEKRDSTYLIRTKTLENNIGMYMFERCENLQHIVMPKNTRTISLRAFGECRALKEVTLPSGVRNVHGAFPECISLETVKVCSDSPLLQYKDKINEGTENMLFPQCNPNLRMVVDNTLETYIESCERLDAERRAKSSNATLFK